MANTLAIGTLSAALNVLAGDRLERHGTMLLQIRRTVDGHDVVVKSVTIGGVQVISAGEYRTYGNAGNVTQIAWEQRMPGATDTIVKVTEAPDHKVTFHYGSGSSDTHDSWADLQGVADALDTDQTRCQQTLKALAYRTSPGGENKTALVGAAMSINIQPASVPFVYTPPQE